MSRGGVTARNSERALIRRDAIAPGLFIVAIGFCAYANSFSGPFVYDDGPSITGNPTIRHLWPLGDVLHPPLAAGVAGRPVLNFSFALNYAITGTEIGSYHLLNLVLHLLAGLLLFGIVRRTLHRCGSWGATRATPLALCSTLLWVAHPVLTSAVTYVSQRAELLMACWYLLALYGFIRAVDAAEDFPDQKLNRRWLLAALGACAFGMATKEVMVTAPVAILLYDRAFVAGRWSEVWRRRAAVHLGFIATWAILAWLMLGVASGGRVYGEHASAISYAIRECRVVLEYLRLCVWPHPLIFDSGRTAGEGASRGDIFVVLALAAGAVALWWRSPKLGFMVICFFLLLAPTSSVVPLPEQPMAENRLYLPLAAFAVSVAVLACHVSGRGLRVAFAGVIVGWLALALRRNQDYRSELAVWRDTVAKAPNNARAYNNLGTTIAAAKGNVADEISAYEAALRLSPHYVEARVNLASTLAREPARLDEALGYFRQAVADEPERGETYFAYGDALARADRANDAVPILTQAKQRLPKSAEVRFNLANALLASGRPMDAMPELESALALDPHLVAAHVNLGNLLAAGGNLAAALAHFEIAVRLAPEAVDSRYALADALSELGRAPEAIGHFTVAVRIAPENADLRMSFARALLAAQRSEEALAQIEAAQALRPADPQIRDLLIELRERARAYSTSPFPRPSPR